MSPKVRTCPIKSMRDVHVGEYLAVYRDKKKRDSWISTVRTVSREVAYYASDSPGWLMPHSSYRPMCVLKIIAIKKEAKA